MKSKRGEAYRQQIMLIAERLALYEKSRAVRLYSNSLTYEVCEDIHHFLNSFNLLQNTVSSIMRGIFASFNAMKRAGITDMVYIERTRGGKVERLSVPRYELVSSHTARRSFATNTYLAGIPAARIMLMTAHSTEEAFFRYIRISRSENAKTLSEHPFFN